VSAGALDVEVDARDAGAGGGVCGVRVDRDRAGVVELRAGGGGAGCGRVGLDGEGVCALGVAGFVGGVVGDGVGAVVRVVAGRVDRDGGAGAVACRAVDLVVGVVDAGAGVRARLWSVGRAQRDRDRLVGPVAAGVDARVGVLGGGGRDGRDGVLDRVALSGSWRRVRRGRPRGCRPCRLRSCRSCRCHRPSLRRWSERCR